MTHCSSPSLAGRILVVDDDVKMGNMLHEYLQQNGFTVTVAKTGMQGLEYHQRKSFDAVVLDLMLPDVDGLDVCRQMRSRDNIPVLMLTAKGDPMDRIIGLELGADDYVPKPFEPRELLARLRAVLRRGRGTKPDAIARFGRLEIDREAFAVRLDGKRCDLTTYQYQLVDALSQAVGRVLSRDFLLTNIKGNENESFDRSIDVHISRIRGEIEDDPKHPRRIITVRGVGYVFAKSQD
ncbi:MAG: response regulator transcription factor [Pseudomonadota bacterium]